MIRHIVFFKFKDSIRDDEVRKLEDGLGALPARIPEIRQYEMGRDITGSEREFDFALVSSFDDIDSLHRYRVHPEHQKILKLVDEICSSVNSVDFEISTKQKAHG